MGFNIYGEVFSKVYDMFWNDFIVEIGPKIVQFYKSRNNTSGATILDLFCGTGRLSKIMLERGFSVIGIDRSKHMLDIATKRNNEFVNGGHAEFIEADAENFILTKKVQHVVATFDSINHLIDEKAVEGCFKSVFNCLETDGTLIFDVNTKRGLKAWNFIDLDDTDDAVFIMQGKYDGKSKQAYSKVIGFLKLENDTYQKFEEIMYNTIFQLSLLKKMLLRIGWENVYFTKEDDLETIITGDPEKELRVFVIAEKG
ncbi:MAG: class I SAM-dependent methyltransferase [Candidatus Kariarchaeaceae archaeon]|jgi:SAM-dependent methyltransferase